MTTRRRAREVALQVIYQDDLNPGQANIVSDRLIRRRLNHHAKSIEFAQSLVNGVRRHREVLDRALTERATNWSLKRMAPTDRNVLRLGAFEILFSDTPDRVAINEAVELAKRFGGAHSAPFVNGILDRLLREATRPDPTQGVPSD
jgi:transcription antitermination protein NusB